MRVAKWMLFLLFSLLISFKVYALEIDLESENAVLYHNDKLMYSQNENQKVQIASLTKIMTAIVALDNINNLDERVTLTNSDFESLAEENLVTAGFKAGDTATYKDLIAGLLLPSGAECAKALERLTTEGFIDKMNAKAEELGMENTHFTNTIGLDDQENYSTVSDVYKMFSYALKNDTFKELITSESYTTTNGKIFYSTVANTNNQYILGGKTGTTDGAGLCLASLANIDGEEFILVTTGAPYDGDRRYNIEDASYVYNYLADNYSTQKIVSRGDVILTLNTRYAQQDKIEFLASEDISYFLPNAYNKDDIVYNYEGTEVLTSGIKQGTKLGTLSIYYQNELIKEVDITLNEKVRLDIFKYIQGHIMEIIVIVLAIILIILLIKTFKKNIMNRKRKQQWQVKI